MSFIKICTQAFLRRKNESIQIHSVKMSGKSNICLNMSQVTHSRISMILVAFETGDVGT